MPFECPGWREFAEFVPDHILCYEDLMEHLPVVDEKRKTHKLRDYRTSSRPGLYWLAGAGINLLIDLDKQLLVNERSFFQRSSHILILESFPQASQALRSPIVWPFCFFVFE